MIAMARTVCSFHAFTSLARACLMGDEEVPGMFKRTGLLAALVSLRTRTSTKTVALPLSTSR